MTTRTPLTLEDLTARCPKQTTDRCFVALRYVNDVLAQYHCDPTDDNDAHHDTAYLNELVNEFNEDT